MTEIGRKRTWSYNKIDSDEESSENEVEKSSEETPLLGNKISKTSYAAMGLYKNYFRFTRHADRLLGNLGKGDDPSNIQMLISQQNKCTNFQDIPDGSAPKSKPTRSTLSWIRRWYDQHECRITLIIAGVISIIIGIVLAITPWKENLILAQLKLWNGSLSFHYWQRPGVNRLTSVYIFNLTNADDFLERGAKPIFEEVGPFVYRETMEKVNIKFNDNGTISFQHNKILVFVPELSVDKDLKLIVPNIPLLTLASQTNNLGYFVQKSISVYLNMNDYQPFVEVTADQLVFGYEDNLVSLAHQFYPERKKPMTKMGLLINRNGTLPEVHTIYTGQTGMNDFGLIEKLNGHANLPFWQDKPCNAIRASEGSFFPPRYYTKSDLVTIYDKDLCRIMPLKYRGPTESKHNIEADLYTPADDIFESVEKEPDNKCYCPGNEYCPPKGLQNISPCQFDAPVYLSFPHFLGADPSLLEPLVGLKPDQGRHGTYFKIQPKLGVPVEGKVRVQLNLKIDQAPYITPVAKFPSMIYPVMWLEEGIDDLPPPIRRWIFTATTLADIGCPLLSYGMIFFGCSTLISVFIHTYRPMVFNKQTIEIGMKNIRRTSANAYMYHHPAKYLTRRETYTLLDLNEGDGDNA